MNKLMLVSIAFALFIVCPRMAGMANVIANHTGINLIQIAILGTLFSLPLTIIMVLVYKKLGLLSALGFCVLTDFLSALFMKEISLKAGLETFIIALFVISGVKIASFISNLLP